MDGESMSFPCSSDVILFLRSFYCVFLLITFPAVCSFPLSQCCHPLRAQSQYRRRCLPLSGGGGGGAGPGGGRSQSGRPPALATGLSPHAIAAGRRCRAAALRETEPRRKDATAGCRAVTAGASDLVWCGCRHRPPALPAQLGSVSGCRPLTDSLGRMGVRC